MQKKKILFISTKGPAGISADEIRIKYFRQALEMSGYEFVVFKINLSGFRKYLLYLLRTPPKELYKKAKDVDLIMATSPSLMNIILGHKVAEKLEKPFIADIRDIWEEYVKTAHPLAYKIGITLKLVREYYEALSYSSQIIVVTDFMKQYYKRTLGIREEKITLISNGTDVELIKPSKEIKREVDIACVVNLNWPYHNLEFLFNALRLEKMTLIIIGGGKYLHELKNTARNLKIYDRILFVGWVPYEKLSTYLCRAKVGVVGRPFLNNIGYLCAIPTKTYDYLAAGLPVVAYGPKNSALEDFIKRNNIGAYINHPDPEILCNELMRIVTEHEEYIERVRALAIKFDRKELSKKLVEVVNNILR